MSNRIYIATLLFTLALPIAVSAGEQGNIRIDIDTFVRNGTHTATLKIKNLSGKKQFLRHPALQNGIAIIVMDEKGNIVPPEGIAKVSPVNKSLELSSGQEYEYTTPVQYAELAKKENVHFPFLTSTGLFGFKLKKGKIYRITAIYRPDGMNGAVVSTTEKVIHTSALTEQEAIANARRLLKKKQLRLDNYQAPVAKYDSGERKWYIIYHHKLPAPPGAYFGITVDDKSGKTTFFLGE